MLPTPIIFPPMIGEVDVGFIACGVDIASLEAAPDASVEADCDPSPDVVTPP